MVPASQQVIQAAIPATALAVLERLWAHGHAGYAVGGGIRDALLGRPGHDIDLATDARPDAILGLFPDGHVVGAFGTVEVAGIQLTTFRRDHTYRDHRRPDTVTWTDDLAADLGRRDFTINAIGWGRPAGSTGAGSGPPDLVDPTGGIADLEALVLRAVGDPDERFDEDALRLLRGARFAATMGLRIEPRTLAAMRAHGPDARWLSGERVGVELRRMLAEGRPSDGLRILDDIGTLAMVLPELTAQHGVRQDKIPGRDLFDHSLDTADAAAALPDASERLILAAVLHDIGKPGTFADGHFIGHAEEGARMARAVLRRLRISHAEAAEVAILIHEHMFQYEPGWTDSAVRRFLRRVGAERIDDLLRLRQADNVGSGQPADADLLPELQARLATQRRSRAPLAVADLAIDGNDILAAVGQPAGPWVGMMLERLLESVVNDPARNRPSVLLADVRQWRAEVVPRRRSPLGARSCSLDGDDRDAAPG
jgi:tRNA nucleotidyltransferase (CCA-adding enzyme)